MNSRASRHTLILFVLAIWLPACHKTSPAAPGPSCPMDSLAGSLTGPVDIYLAGWRSMSPSGEIAGWWKNDVETDLTDGSRFITANSIAVSGADVYVGGNEFVVDHFVAKYWKNGAMTDLAGPGVASYVNCATVSGSDVYFAGYENDGGHNIAKYWKNGRGVSLTSGANDAEITSLVVACHDVYAAGWEASGGAHVAKYWKNGSPVTVGAGPGSTEALSIAVSGTDVYVAGNQYIYNDSCPLCNGATAATVVSKIWKNGTVIDSGGTVRHFNSIAIANGNLFAAGTDSSSACYFINGHAIHLTDGKHDAQAVAIAVWGSDIYVTGYENILGHNVATYWKNGAAVRLSDGTNNAYSLAIFAARSH